MSKEFNITLKIGGNLPKEQEEVFHKYINKVLKIPGEIDFIKKHFSRKEGVLIYETSQPKTRSLRIEEKLTRFRLTYHKRSVKSGSTALNEYWTPGMGYVGRNKEDGTDTVIQEIPVKAMLRLVKTVAENKGKKMETIIKSLDTFGLNIDWIEKYVKSHGENFSAVTLFKSYIRRHTAIIDVPPFIIQ